MGWHRARGTFGGGDGCAGHVRGCAVVEKGIYVCLFAE